MVQGGSLAGHRDGLLLVDTDRELVVIVIVRKLVIHTFRLASRLVSTHARWPQYL